MTWSDGRCEYCDRHPPGYPPWQHSDWIHNNTGNRSFDRPFPFTDEEQQILKDWLWLCTSWTPRWRQHET